MNTIIFNPYLTNYITYFKLFADSIANRKLLVFSNTQKKIGILLNSVDTK